MKNANRKDRSRRTFLKSGAGVLGGIALGVSPDLLPTLAAEAQYGREGHGRQRQTHRPNVVLIISDEHQHRALGCYGSANRTVTGESPTPNIDKLAAEGVLFENVYSASPLCAPARAALITGTYPHVNTAMFHKYRGDARGHYRFPGILPTMTTIGDAFRRGGYATAAIGKNALPRRS